MATYTLEQVRAARERALAAGDRDAADRLGRYAVQLAMQQAPRDEYNPTEGMSTLDLLRAGIGRGIANVGRHIANFAGVDSVLGMDTSDEGLREAERIDQALMNTGAGKAGSFIGEMAALPVPMAGATGALTKLGGAAARAVGGVIRRGAVEGAAQGAIMADPGERLSGALTGAALGSALPAAARGVSRVARGVERTPEAERLLAEGIDLTPGQMNPRGVLNRMEQALEGTLGIGDVIQNAREGAMRQFNRRFVERAMPPGATLTSRADDFNVLVDEAARAFDTAYDVVKGYPVGAKIMRETGEDVPLAKAFADIAKKPRLGLTERAREDIAEQLQGTLNEMIQSARRSRQGLTSDDLLTFRSMLRQAVRDEAGDTVESRARQALLREAEKKVTEAIESQLPSDVSRALRETDRQFAQFAVVRSAARKAKDRPGGPTPYQVSQAIAEATGDLQYARGGGLNRDLSKAAMEVFQSNVPRTGLSGMGRLGAVIGGAVMQPALVLPALGGIGALVGTQTGRRIAAGATAPQRRLAEALARTQRLPQPARNVTGRYARSLLAAATND